MNSPSFRQAFHLHRHLFFLTGAYGAAVLGLAFSFDATADDFSAVFSYFIPAAATSFFFPILILLAFSIKTVAAAVKEGKTPKWAIDNFEGRIAAYIRNGRLHNALAALLALLPVTLFFCIGKSMIPLLNEYRLDPLFAEADKITHFGRYPHEYLVPWIEKLELQHFFDDLYLCWFMIVYLVTEFATWGDPDQTRRMRYLWTYALCWIVIGTVAAIALASVGPMYFHDFYDAPSPYGDLLAHLRAAGDLKIFVIAEELLNMVKDERTININAISAMPSLHVAMAAALCFYFRSVNRAAWIFLSAFLIFMIMGSVYLGWHYAIDGYIGIAMAYGLWRASGPIVIKLYEETSGSR